MRRYFEGWYFKQVSVDLSSVYAFIPGIALETERSAFIQVIDGMSGRTRFLPYPLKEFSAARDRFHVEVGNSAFCTDYIDLNIDRPELKVRGRIDFSETSFYPRRLFSPGIMGPYSFVPKMECKHGLVSMDHRLSGSIEVDRRSIDFSGGRGYIEKDWGSSFPESWIWMQSNNFSRPGDSFMLSVAEIPWLRGRFVGFLSFLKRGEKTRFFASYNGGKITHLKNLSSGDGSTEAVSLHISRGAEKLFVRAESTRRGALKSPVAGRMDSYIRESVDAVIDIDYRGPEGERFKDRGLRGGLEIVEEIFDA